MADNQIVIKLRIDDKGNLKKASSQTEKLSKSTDKATRSTDRLQKSRDKYNRTEKGVAQISSNSTKNFSKMQQSIGGGDGSGGLVRAYALLAANVFALTAAFGVLSRASQIEVLTQSIERLEIVSGKSIRQVGRDLQEASGFSLDFASSLRSVSLATSAGFNAKQISELGEVAKNASVSLGRNLADGLDRIFRGVIKVEPELLDEIGLFVRVNEAANKYAADLGVAASDLTEFQKRQAFANEAITQGQKKFSAFADIDPAPLDKLSASLSDIAQTALSVVTGALNPILSFFQENQQFLAAAFSAVAFALLRQAVPALGTFAINAKQAALDAQAAFQATEQAAKEALEGERAGLLEKALKKEKDITKEVKKRVGLTEKGRSGFGGKAVQAARDEFKAAKTSEEKIAALGKERDALNLSKRRASDANIKLIEKEQKLIDKQILKEKSLMRAVRDRKKIQSQPVASEALQGTAFDLAKEEARVKVLRQTSVESVSNVISTQGFTAGLKELGKQTGKGNKELQNLGFFTRLATKASIGAQGGFLLFGDAVSKAMRVLGPITLLLSIVGPIFVTIAKSFGFISKESKAYGAQLAATTELQETFNEKLAHTSKQLALLETDDKFSFAGQADAIAAATNAIAEYSRSILDLAEKEKLLRAQRIEAGLIDPSAGKRAREIRDQIKSLLAGLGTADFVPKETLDLLSGAGIDINKFRASFKEVEQARKEFEAAPMVRDFAAERADPLGGKQFKPNTVLFKLLQDADNKRRNILKEMTGILFDNEALQVSLTEMTESQAKASLNVKSALDGATDSVREFRKKFITSTDIDKPLASLIAFNKSLTEQVINGETIKLTEEEKEARLNQIINKETDLLKLLDAKVARKIKETKLDDVIELANGENISGQQFILNLLEEQEQAQRKIQVQTVLLKDTIKITTAEMKAFGDAAKGSFQGVAKEGMVALMNAQMATAIATDNARIARNAVQKTREEIEDLAALEQDELIEALKLENDRNGVLGAINKHKEEELKKIEETLATQTAAFRMEQGMLELRVKSLNAEIKLNETLAANQKIRAQIEKIRQGRSGTLSPVEELELDLKAFAAGKQDRDDKLKNEERIGELKSTILKAEFDTFMKRYKLELEMIELKLRAERTLSTEQEKALGNVKEMLNTASAQTPEAINKLDAELKASREEENGKTLSFYKKLLDVNNNLFKQDPNKFLELGSKINTGLRIASSEELPKAFDAAREAEGRRTDISDEQIQENINKINADEKMFKLRTSTLLAADALTTLGEGFKQFGPDGEVAAAMSSFGATIAASFATLNDEETNGAAAMAALGSIVGSMANLMTAASNAKIAGVEKEIEAEKKRDGKSKESLAKIQQMEAKKDQMARKAFEQNKKMQIAMTIINTATAVMGILANESAKFGMLAIPLAVMVGAMGAAQIAMIKSQQYQGSGGGDTAAASAPMNLSIGSRGNEVDVSQQANRGELAYLRGEEGRGTISNFTPAASGRRGYAVGSEGVVVGERGPEVISPSMPIDITPNDKIGGGTTNVNFTIHAVDAAGLEQTLQSQRGNIIGMIREAANGYGQNFLETVDIDTLNEGGTY